MNESEVWKDIPGFAGWYEVSNMGEVRRAVAGPSTFPGKVLAQHGLGCKWVGLSRNGRAAMYRVHILVLEAFRGPKPPGHECRHTNGDTADNHLENLSWAMDEEWRDVVGYEGWYKVSSKGRLKNVRTGRLYRQYPKSEYRKVTLVRDKIDSSVWMHNLVLEAFIGPRPVGCECHHRNGVKGDNEVENLIWITHCKHMRIPNGQIVLDVDRVHEVRELSRMGYSIRDIADRFGVSVSTIGHILRGYTWKNVG